jgi:ABC-type polysaccharide/polyol phosphate transport system ATPase subunit
MANALTFEHVSKHYRGAGGYRALRDDLVRLVPGRAAAAQPEVVALDDVSLEIPEGQSFALIGANGAGKTTALKLATRIAYPTSGRVRVRGRVGALLEVGTGLHPELTGRENIALYGRILGLSRAEVARRFDEIVEFAGIGPALDRPLKQYSSGMQLRLGFSVAAHLEPDVLLVDEAISVGDAGFQYRCVERMSELVREGRTLVLVSHDMGAIEALCKRAVLLRSGSVAMDAPARDVVAAYLGSVDEDRLAASSLDGTADGAALEILQTTLHDADGTQVDTVPSGSPLTVRIHYRAHEPVPYPVINVGLVDGRIGCFSLASMLRDGGSPDVLIGDGTVDCTFADLPLLPRVYEIWCGIRGELAFGNLVAWQRLRRFRVVDDAQRQGKVAATMEMTNAPVTIPYSWTFRNGSAA